MADGSTAVHSYTTGWTALFRSRTKTSLKTSIAHFSPHLVGEMDSTQQIAAPRKFLRGLPDPDELPQEPAQIERPHRRLHPRTTVPHLRFSFSSVRLWYAPSLCIAAADIADIVRQ